MLRKMLDSCAVLFCAGALAGCQQTASPFQAGGDATILAAGFKMTETPRQAAPSGALAAYVCPVERCGALVVLVVGAKKFDAPPSTGLTAEQAIKSGIFRETKLRSLMEEKFLSSFSAAAARANSQQGNNLTQFALDTRSAALRFSGVVTSPLTEPLRYSGYGRFVGNEMHVIVAVAKSLAAARRYARVDWLP